MPSQSTPQYSVVISPYLQTWILVQSLQSMKYLTVHSFSHVINVELQSCSQPLTNESETNKIAIVTNDTKCFILLELLISGISVLLFKCLNNNNLLFMCQSHFFIWFFSRVQSYLLLKIRHNSLYWIDKHWVVVSTFDSWRIIFRSILGWVEK